MPNLSFVIFGTGFQFALLALFSAACDLGGLRIGLFRTFGTNPLAAYFIHGGMALVLAVVVPHDASLAICLVGFAVTFAITCTLVRIWNEPACIGVFDPRGLRGLTSGAKNSVWTEFNAFLEFRPPKKGHSAAPCHFVPVVTRMRNGARHTRSRSIPRRSRTDDSQGPDP